MKVLAYLHAYPPYHNAGAEWMLKAMFDYFLTKGAQCAVVSRNLPDGEFEGVKTIQLRKHPSDGNFEQILNLYSEYDIIYTHLDCTGDAIQTHDKMKKKPLYWVCHNSHVYPAMKYRTGRYNVVYNTHWLKEKMNYDQSSLICYPPVYTANYSLNSNTKEYITLLNCNEAKGGKVLIELAKAMPDRKFMGVIGHYGVQEEANLPNLIYKRNTPNVREEVYAKSSIVIMPSSYESFGRVAMEAYSAGIPVIAHPTEGLTESMGEGGLFANRHDVAGWKHWISQLDNKEFYQKQSEYGLKRAKQTEDITLTQLESLYQNMTEKL